MPAAATEAVPSAPEQAVALYGAAYQIHREARQSKLAGRDSEAEFLRGISLTARRWADAAAV